MERKKIATKLTSRIAEFVNQKGGLVYDKNEDYYFHYPNFTNYLGFKVLNHTSNYVEEDYQEVTEQEFLDYFNEPTFEFGERVKCSDGLKRVFLFKKDDGYYCIGGGQEWRFNENRSFSVFHFKSIQKLPVKLEPTKEEKLNRIIEQLKELL